MKALVLEEKGAPFNLRTNPDPVPGEGEVLIRLEASALNHRDSYIQRGMYPRTTYPVICGSDGAGVVIGVGNGVSESLINNEVVIDASCNWGDDPRVQQKSFKLLGLPDQGTFAELIKVPLSQVFPKPPHLTFAQAAALPVAGVTAYRALFTRARLQKGERVLVTGIGGGVAVFALQFALAHGADVYVTSGSEEKIQRARALGAKGGVLYDREKWGSEIQELAGQFDAIIDGAAGSGFATLLDIAAPAARIVIYGSVAGKIRDAEAARIFWKQLNILGSTMGTPQDFRAMLNFVEDHRIVPVVDEVFPLDQANDAIARLRDSAQFGKVVLRNRFDL